LSEVLSYRRERLSTVDEAPSFIGIAGVRREVAGVMRLYWSQTGADDPSPRINFSTGQPAAHLRFAGFAETCPALRPTIAVIARLDLVWWLD
jgi:hypothetical protein